MYALINFLSCCLGCQSKIDNVRTLKQEPLCSQTESMFSISKDRSEFGSVDANFSIIHQKNRGPHVSVVGDRKLQSVKLEETEYIFFCICATL